MGIVVASSPAQNSRSALAGLEGAYETLLESHLIATTCQVNLSLKLQSQDLFGEPVEAMAFLNAHYSRQACSTVVRLSSLRALCAARLLPAEGLRSALSLTHLQAGSADLDEEVFLHAVSPSSAAILISTNPILALGSVSDFGLLLSREFGSRVIAVEYGLSAFSTAVALSKALAEVGPVALEAVYLRRRGLLVFGDDLEQAALRAADLASLIEKVAGVGPSTGRPSGMHVAPNEEPIRVELSKQRKDLSTLAGRPLLLRTHLDEHARALSSDRVLVDQALSGSFSTAFSQCFLSTSLLGQTSPDFEEQFLPRMRGAHGSSVALVDPKRGLQLTAATPAHLVACDDLLFQELQIIQLAARLGSLKPIRDAGPQSRTASYPDETTGLFAGEVALVSGAATGIGKACVQSLIARGAAVVALDIREEITGLIDSPAYLGLVCDLTDEPAILRSLEIAVRAFGGIDMLVLNAGIFPASCNIDALTLEHWRKVMTINLDSNVILLREIFPLLKNAPRYGRVIINASRNVPAPGPGAAAYSASKAALTQLGRVAALEWAKSGVRVNMINPHAVFDTGIWTAEVIQSRAAKYNLTVDQYKKNNLLAVELSSHDVGELVAEMCGPLFSKTTGAQVPVDGGSDRVI